MHCRDAAKLKADSEVQVGKDVADTAKSTADGDVHMKAMETGNFDIYVGRHVQIPEKHKKAAKMKYRLQVLNRSRKNKDKL